MQYKQVKNNAEEVREDLIVAISNGIIMGIPNDPANADWQQYQAWLAEDPENQPEEAD